MLGLNHNFNTGQSHFYVTHAGTAEVKVLGSHEGLEMMRLRMRHGVMNVVNHDMCISTTFCYTLTQGLQLVGSLVFIVRLSSRLGED